MPADHSSLLSSYAAPDRVAHRLARVRRDVGGALVARAFARFASIGRLSKKAQPAAHGVELVRDVAYLDDGRREHTLDVYRPRDADNAPVVLYLHGGAFRSLSKD